MKRLRNALLLLVACCGLGMGLAACDDGGVIVDSRTSEKPNSVSPSAPSSSSSSPNEEDTYQVKGRILDNSTKNPIKNIVVSLSKVNDSSVNFKSNTKDDGTFSFTDIDEGNYTLLLVLDDKYEEQTSIPKIELTAENMVCDLGDILLKETDSMGWSPLT